MEIVIALILIYLVIILCYGISRISKGIRVERRKRSKN